MKYPSIKNHYMNKHINFKKNEFGDRLEGTTWSVEEKIDGCNIAFEFSSNEPTKFYSRNQEIIGDEFYKSWNDLKEYEKRLTPIKEYVDKWDITIKLFSEYYGPGIQGRVDYGAKRRFIFFDMVINGVFASKYLMKDFFKTLNLGSYVTNSLKVFDTIEEALEFDINFNSQYSNKPNNPIEGIVIKPYNKTLIDGYGVPFYLKKKNIKEKTKKKNYKHKTYSDKVNDIHNIFISYINKNRVLSIFSKEGQMEEVSELGKYIPLIRNDAIEDFNDENEFDSKEFDKKENKFIFNCSKEIVELLKEEL